jgi:hypothetical protein
MANKYTEQDLQNAQANIVDTISRFIQLKKNGADYSACCPFHDEQTPSFTVSDKKGFFHCFGCGAHGDSIDFVMQYEGLPFPDAVQRIIGNLPDAGQAQSTQRTKTHKPKPAVWQPLLKAKSTATESDFLHRRHGKPTHVWEYRNQKNELTGYVCRFPITKPDGTIGKETLPLAWCVNSETGAIEWRFLGFGIPRPLYGLQKLATKKPVIIFEGEKTADAGQNFFKAANTLTWPGGGNGVNNADFMPLAGEDVTLWPDFDWQIDVKTGELIPEHSQPGIKAMRAVYEKIKDIANSVRIVKPSRDFQDGWDVADDAPMDNFSPFDYAKNNVVPASEYFADPITEQEPEALPEQTAVQIDQEKDMINKNIRILGFDRGSYYVYSFSKKQIVELKKSDFTQIGLIEIAPAEFWEILYPAKNGFSKDKAAEWIINTAHERGIFNPSMTRGRGAWIDNKRVVYHFGDQLSVDGILTPVTAIASKFIYENQNMLPVIPSDAMTVSESESIYNISTQFRWSRDASAPLLAGWIALAPFCGALKWRPHVWISGGAGCGKTTIVNDYIHTLLNGIDLFAQGNSTEAGIRQMLGSDARPVIFDESEQNDEREQSRVQNILSLIRQASSESAALTLKGTATGSAMTFLIRSMFCLSSIQVGMKHQADKERLIILNLRPKHEQSNATDQWRDLSNKLQLLQRDETAPSRLFMRSLSLLPITLQNIKIFSDVCSKKFNSVREGDQIGTLMAGAYSMLSDDIVTPEFARDYIDSFSWDEHRDYAETDEAMAALSTLMECRIRGAYGETSVYETIKQSINSATPDDYRSLLERYGMKIKDGYLLVSNSSHAIKELMKNTPYAADIKGQLIRIKGAKRWENEKFSGTQSRSVGIPLGIIDLAN